MISKSREKAIIEEIIGSDKTINPTLFKNYSDNLRNAINSVFYEDNASGLSDRLRANVSLFAAYKAYHATQLIKKNKDDSFLTQKVLHTFNRYQAAEYNTTVSRCRSAKQFESFVEKDNIRLFPNLRWLPSRSVHLREKHVVFYNRIWAKTDPFWNTNQPGNLWNCKCDWEETNNPITDGNPTNNVSAKGLDGNPAVTGEVFTNKCTYIEKAGKITLDNETSQQYPALQKLIDVNTKEWRLDYYSDKGGLLLTNKNRIKEGKRNSNEKAKFDKEYNMCKTLANNDIIVEYRETIENSFDIYLNGKAAELKKVSSHNNIVKYALHAIKNQKAEIVVFEFIKETKEIHKQIEILKKSRIKGWYFFSNKKLLYGI